MQVAYLYEHGLVTDVALRDHPPSMARSRPVGPRLEPTR
jgi:hypothetical protein